MSAIRFNCPQCSQDLDVSEETAGTILRCPSCGASIQVPALAAGSRSGALCGICLSPISESEPKRSCPACRADYHAECWEENGGCAVYGCSQVPAIEKREAIEIPMSYWGQENKQCPSCKKEILAAAVRCRHCGATFESAQPQDAEEFRRRSELKLRLPVLRRTVVLLFICSVLPFLAPVGAVWGLMWYPAHREEVKTLPAIYGALCKIGLLIAISLTVGVVVLALLFSFVRK